MRCTAEKTDIPIDIGFRWIFYSSNVFYWLWGVSVNPLYRLSVCIDIGFKIVSSGVRTWVPIAGVLYTCRFEPSSSQLPSTQINKCMPSLYSTYVYKQYIACSRQAFTWNSWFERKLLSYCGGVRTWVRLRLVRVILRAGPFRVTYLLLKWIRWKLCAKLLDIIHV